MARIDQDGFEDNTLAIATGRWTTVSTTGASITSGSARSGSYGLRISSLSSGTAAGVLFKWLAATAAGPYFFRVYLNAQTFPSASNHIISFNGASGTVGSTPRAKITLENNGTLILRNGAGTQVGSASSALSLGTSYRVGFKFDATGTGATDTLEAQLNGVTFATDSTQTLSNVFAYSVGGNLDAEAQTVGEWWFDDIALNDGTGSFQTTYPPDERIINLLGNAAGDVNTFATQTGGTVGATNNFTRVNEAVPDDATTFNGSSTLNEEDLVSLAASGFNSYDTVNVVMIGGRFRNNTADTTTAFKFEVEKTAGGTITQSAAIVPNSTAWRSNGIAVPRLYPIILYQDPDGSAWNNTTLDSMQIGYKLTIANVNRIDVTQVVASVAYTPGTPPGGTNSNFLAFT